MLRSMFNGSHRTFEEFQIKSVEHNVECNPIDVLTKNKENSKKTTTVTFYLKSVDGELKRTFENFLSMEEVEDLLYKEFGKDGIERAIERINDKN